MNNTTFLTLFFLNITHSFLFAKDISLPLPEVACTPEAYQPRLDQPNPFEKDKSLKLDTFFYDEDPKWWLPEIYAASHGGNTSGYVEGLRVMLTRRHFPLRSSVRILLQYCESDRGKEQLELLGSFSTFEVVSSHLAVNAGIRLGGQLEYKMHSSTSHSANAGTVSRDDQVDDTCEKSPRKRTRNGDDDDDRGISCVFCAFRVAKYVWC